MEKYILCSRRDIDSIIKNLLDDSRSETAESVSKMIYSEGAGWELEAKDFEIPEEFYEEKIKLPEYDYQTDNKMCLELAKILVNNREEIVNDKDKNREVLSRVLNPETIERLLINRENSTLNTKVFYALCDLRANMRGVDLSGVYIHGCDFRGLKNLTIDLDEVKDKDLINVNFAGVTLEGSLDNCKLYYTRFAGCNAHCKLNPQTIAHKSMVCTDLRDMTVEGNFDGVKIDHCNFVGAKGRIEINPQTVYNKTLEGLNLMGCYIVGENGGEPSFKGCKIKNCDFNGVKNKLTFNLDDLEYYTISGANDSWERVDIKTKLFNCNIIGNTLTGNVLLSELKTILYACSIYDMPVWPNRSATTEVWNAPLDGYLLWRDNPIDLSNPKDYDRNDVHININIIDSEEEKVDTYPEEETKLNNQKRLKKMANKKRVLDFFKNLL